ncbi:hypothetical protein NEMBOFW57_003568 [Staphylotrichum longicolle]|uniref:Uncharacterized protein n=1 Tax=Staphylotrichum longicolle TaxID=669026 RepID=A0AAD4F569_9PEZI|nr:hypothetical protein NEMBOFW57_003568 [Staphylotrichum longicolle]
MPLEIARGSLRPLKLTGLPVEILRLVLFNILEEDGTAVGAWDIQFPWTTSRLDADRARRRDIGALRLVCRLFSELAAPLLFPTLALQVTQSSLDLAEKIAKNPAIAAGVRGIRLYLGYRPTRYSDSLAQYWDMRLSTLQRLERYHNYCYEPYEWRCSASWGEDEEDEDEAKLRQAMEKCGRVRGAWREYVESALNDGEEADRAPLSEYQEIFQRGYSEFCRLHREQRRLLQHGTFADALATAVARMPNASSVAFFDTSDSDGTTMTHAELESRILGDNETLYQFLVSPLNWDTIEKRDSGVGQGVLNHTPELECVRLLWELPIALHRAGAGLTELWINSFPQHDGNFSALQAQDRTTGVPAWDDLGAACQNLEAFELLVTSSMMSRDNSLPPRDKASVDNFLGAVLSRCGTRLRSLSLNLYGLSVKTDRPGTSFEGAFHSDPFLGRLKELPRLHCLSLRHVELERETFKSLCNGLGSDLRDLDMVDVLVHGGGWADAVDTLREKMATAFGREVGYCSLYGLYGPEFVGTDVPPVEDGSEDSLSEDSVSQDDSDVLSTAVQKYIQGLREHNPLRERGG